MNNRFSFFIFHFSIKSQSGQVIVILLLLMLVALSVGLSLAQKSVTDVTTSTQTEQSQRAFSAAEAGIEKALGGPFPSQGLSLDNTSKVVVNSTGKLPDAGSTLAIEFPPIGRETTAQIWLTDPDNEGVFYDYPDNPSLDLYFGNKDFTEDKPAVEVKVVMKSSNKFYSKTYYYDSLSSRAGQTGNNFSSANCNDNGYAVDTILGINREFYCKQTIGPIMDLAENPPLQPCTSLNNCRLILARVRFLYTIKNHNLALDPSPFASGANSNFPPQVQIYNATGTSGQSQKQIQAFKVIDVVPSWFDFAIFSIDKIEK